MQKIMYSIGWEYPEHLWERIKIIFICLFFSSCGNIKDVNSVKVYAFYEVDQPPMYNNEQWDIGLLRDFNSKFTAQSDNETSILTQLIFQFIVTNNGTISNISINGKNEKDLSGYEKAGLRALKLCQNWTPGMKNGSPVNVELVFPIRF